MKKGSNKKKDNAKAQQSKDVVPDVASPARAEVDDAAKKDETAFTRPDLHPLRPEAQARHFTGVINRDTAVKPIYYEELDGLQVDLESALTKIAKRQTTLGKETLALDASGSGPGYFERFKAKSTPPSEPSTSKEKRRSPDNEPKQPLKRMKEEDSAKSDMSGAFSRASSSSLPEDYMNDNDPFQHHVQHEESPMSPHLVHKFEIPLKFWKYVEPYCGNITQDNISYLEQLIRGTEESERLLKIPPTLGKHYYQRFLELNGKEAPALEEVEEKYSTMLGIQADRVERIRKTAPPIGPVTQRFISCLSPGGAAAVKGEAGAGPSRGVDRKTFLASLNVGGGADMERRLRAQLEENGILEPDDENNNADDELMADWKMTARKLAIVTKTNREILSFLMKQASVQVKKQELFEQMDKVDAAGVEMYQKLVQAKIKKKAVAFSKKEREAGWKLLIERQEIVNQLKDLNEQLDASYTDPFPGLPGETPAMKDEARSPESPAQDSDDGSMQIVPTMPASQ